MPGPTVSSPGRGPARLGRSWAVIQAAAAFRRMGRVRRTVGDLAQKKVCTTGESGEESALVCRILHQAQDTIASGERSVTEIGAKGGVSHSRDPVSLRNRQR